MTKQVSIQTGTLAADTFAPLWNDVFPSLVDPDHRIHEDDFATTTTASIDGRSIPKGSEAWVAASGGIYNSTMVNAAGYAVAGDVTAPAYARFTIGSGADIDIGATIKNGTDIGTAGIIFRHGSSGRYIARISFVGNLVVLGKDTESVLTTPPTNIVTAALDTVAGQEHSLRVRATGNLIKVYVDGIECISYTDTSGVTLEENTSAGIYFYTTDGKILDIMGGSLT